MQEDVEEHTIGGLRIRIDRTRCIATENCIRVAPEVFELGEDLIVTFREDAKEIERERMIEACAVCPVDVFSAYDEEDRPVLL